jgi:hypothetical protein
MSEATEQPAVEQTPVTEAAPVASVNRVNEDGSFNRDAFPDDLGKHSSFDKWGNIDEYIKGAINQSKFVGQKAEEWFGSDDPDATVKRRDILGIPDATDGYDIAYPESFSTLDEGSQGLLKTSIEDITAKAAELEWGGNKGVPKELLQGLINLQLDQTVERHNEMLQTQENAFNDASDALKGEWRGDKYDENVEKSDNMAKFLGMEILIPYMEANPELRKSFFEGASKITNDDTIIESKQQESFATLNEQMDDIDDKMLSYDGPTTDRAYQRMLDKKMAMLSKLS